MAIVIHEGVQALDVAGPLDVFAEANAMLRPERGYDISVVAAERRPLRASNGMSITADLDFLHATSIFGTALVAGGPTIADRTADAEMSHWLRGWGARASRYGSLCTGAFALGRAGLLDGRFVTVRREDAPRLAAMFPAAHIEQDRAYLRERELVTSAGATAGVDLALALVDEDHGPAVSLACADRLAGLTHRRSNGPRTGGQPFPDLPSPIERVQVHVPLHLREPLGVDRLAQIAGTSTRTLARLFTTELATTPHEFVEGLRVARAQILLRSTGLALKVLAFECGFGGAEQMRVVFQRRLGVSPAAYRRSALR